MQSSDGSIGTLLRVRSHYIVALDIDLARLTILSSSDLEPSMVLRFPSGIFLSLNSTFFDPNFLILTVWVLRHVADSVRFHFITPG